MGKSEKIEPEVFSSVSFVAAANNGKEKTKTIQIVKT
jgi:hypothetical protein